MVGVLVFSFYQFNRAPLFFNSVPLEKLRSTTGYNDSLRSLEYSFDQVAAKKQKVLALYAAEEGFSVPRGKQLKWVDSLRQLHQQSDSLRRKVKSWIDQTGPIDSSNDTNYIFLRFVMDHLPHGLVGLLIAIIFLASWGSIAAAINSLAACTLVDFHKRYASTPLSEQAAFKWSRGYT